MANHVFIMAGGSGTRFWPRSTKVRPKQFLSFSGSGRSLLQMTFDRVSNLFPRENICVLTTEKYSPLVEQQLPGVAILPEPEPRNTAPCIYWAAREVMEKDSQAVMAVLPADAFVRDDAAYLSSLKTALSWAQEHHDLVTLGVVPTRPDTGFGYLEARAIPSVSDVFQVARFVEKPDSERAMQYLNAGNFLWNAGMFVWKASTVLEDFSRSLPQMDRVWQKVARGTRADRVSVYKEYPKISVDFGVMEKARSVVTVKLDCGWDDLGSWQAIVDRAAELGLQSFQDNSVANGNVSAQDSHGNLVDAPGFSVGLVGVSNLVIVREGNQLLICEKTRAQDVRGIAKAFEEEN